MVFRVPGVTVMEQVEQVNTVCLFAVYYENWIFMIIFVVLHVSNLHI